MFGDERFHRGFDRFRKVFARGDIEIREESFVKFIYNIFITNFYREIFIGD